MTKNGSIVLELGVLTALQTVQIIQVRQKLVSSETHQNVILVNFLKLRIQTCRVITVSLSHGCMSCQMELLQYGVPRAASAACTITADGCVVMRPAHGTDGRGLRLDPLPHTRPTHATRHCKQNDTIYKVTLLRRPRSAFV